MQENLPLNVKSWAPVCQGQLTEVSKSRASTLCTSKTVHQQKFKCWLVEWWSSGQSADDPVWETITELNKEPEAMKCSLKPQSISALSQICQASLTTLVGSSTLVLLSDKDFIIFQNSERIVQILGSLCEVKLSFGFHDLHCASISAVWNAAISSQHYQTFLLCPCQNSFLKRVWKVGSEPRITPTFYCVPFKSNTLVNENNKTTMKNFPGSFNNRNTVDVVWDKSWRNACSEKCFMSCLLMMDNFDLNVFACLTIAMTQWSLMLLANMEGVEYLCGTFVTITSINDDLSGALTFGLVALLTIWNR